MTTFSPSDRKGKSDVPTKKKKTKQTMAKKKKKAEAHWEEGKKLLAAGVDDLCKFVHAGKTEEEVAMRFAIIEPLWDIMALTLEMAKRFTQCKVMFTEEEEL